MASWLYARLHGCVAARPACCTDAWPHGSMAAWPNDRTATWHLHASHMANAGLRSSAATRPHPQLAKDQLRGHMPGRRPAQACPPWPSHVTYVVTAAPLAPGLRHAAASSRAQRASCCRRGGAWPHSQRRPMLRCGLGSERLHSCEKGGGMQGRRFAVRHSRPGTPKASCNVSGPSRCSAQRLRDGQRRHRRSRPSRRLTRQAVERA